MTTETARAFLNQLAEDTALQARMTQAVEEAPENGFIDTILATAHEAGYPLTADDMARCPRNASLDQRRASRMAAAALAPDSSALSTLPMRASVAT